MQCFAPSVVKHVSNRTDATSQFESLPHLILVDRQDRRSARQQDKGRHARLMIEAVGFGRQRVGIMGDVADEVGGNCGKDHTQDLLHSLAAVLAVFGVRRSDMSTIRLRH